jgi:DNA repair protein RadC
MGKKYVKIPQVAFKWIKALEVSEKIERSIDVEYLLRQAWQDDIAGIESFYVVALNRANKVININCISKGGVHATVVDPKVVFLHAIKSGACGIIVAHNHPSGTLTPSQEDNSITSKLIQAGKMLELPVLDHLILAPEAGYYSYADNGNM